MSYLVASSVEELQQQRKKLKGTVALVPTMGALHQGHLHLVQLAKQHADYVIMSIFVNPTQFAANEDLDQYPRDLAGDLKKGASAGVDLFFTPTSEQMYPKGFDTWVIPDPTLTQNWEALSRPSHFRGVVTVVLKLLLLVQPQYAIFGLKDYQQWLIIKKMVDDLNVSVQLIPSPIVRENSGLAMSSRNQYLSGEEHQTALQIYQSLQYAKARIINKKITDLRQLLTEISTKFLTHPTMNMDYISFVDPDQLISQETFEESTLLLIAIYVGNTRLIDNGIICTNPNLPQYLYSL